MFISRWPQQLFCIPGHKRQFENLQVKRGYLLAPLMAAWRAGGRGGDKALATYAYREACALLDAHAAEDKAAGRNPALVIAAKERASWRAKDTVA